MPPQMNRMSLVFTSMYFCCGCFGRLRRHVRDRALEDLEERLLHALAETSRVSREFSDLREILSSSSM